MFVNYFDLSSGDRFDLLIYVRLNVYIISLVILFVKLCEIVVLYNRIFVIVFKDMEFLEKLPAPFEKKYSKLSLVGEDYLSLK